MQEKTYRKMNFDLEKTSLAMELSYFDMLAKIRRIISLPETGQN